MTRALIWGSLTRLSAFLSGTVVLVSSADPISNVWRFGRDSRHVTNNGMVVAFHGRCTVMNLNRTQISFDLEINKSIEILYASSQIYVCAQNIRDGAEL